mmetsp:Transcript_49644/g.142377  ORF Transcript_49644/g.142377 Transcript_49644/m.142377 type:complete len:326 (+) Transcript_49644:152-1129(+)
MSPSASKTNPEASNKAATAGAPASVCNSPAAATPTNGGSAKMAAPGTSLSSQPQLAKSSGPSSSRRRANGVDLRPNSSHATCDDGQRNTRRVAPASTKKVAPSWQMRQGASGGHHSAPGGMRQNTGSPTPTRDGAAAPSAASGRRRRSARAGTSESSTGCPAAPRAVVANDHARASSPRPNKSTSSPLTASSGGWSHVQVSTNSPFRSSAHLLPLSTSSSSRPSPHRCNTATKKPPQSSCVGSSRMQLSNGQCDARAPPGPGSAGNMLAANLHSSSSLPPRLGPLLPAATPQRSGEAPAKSTVGHPPRSSAGTSDHREYRMPLLT